MFCFKTGFSKTFYQTNPNNAEPDVVRLYARSKSEIEAAKMYEKAKTVRPTLKSTNRGIHISSQVSSARWVNL